MSYHKAEIKKGVVGEISKIQEELDELKDAKEQSIKIMELCELADILLAMKKYVKKHHPNTTMWDIVGMAMVTERAEEKYNGRLR